MPDFPVISGVVPANLECKISNADWQALMALVRVPITAVNETISATEPGPALRAYPWQKLDADGTPRERYIYANGAWLSLHPDPPGAVWMYEGSEISLETWDGGESGAVSATTGPFWEVVTQMAAKFPIGPGTLESTTVVAIGGEGGSEKHALTIPEIPPHTHPVEGSGFDDGATPSARKIIIDDEHNASANNSVTELTGGTAGVVVAHNNLPPFRAIWFIRRTARLFRRGS